ncbi:hypothetical protein [Brevibacillus sp. NRS-1366]|uniref:hypothetical protein n=1 Tax=Brevibacillus sp. NRS-1366 TaxID=3233899 RepID=UPI003D230796
MRNFDQEIEAKRNEFEEVKHQLSNTRNQFKAALIPFVQQQFKTEAEKVIKRNPELVKELGIEKLKELKDELAILSANAPDIINEFFDEEQLWWDLKENEHLYFCSGKYLPDHLNKALRLVIGKFGELFSKYDLIKIKPTGQNDYDVWIERDEYTRSHKHNGRPSYPNRLECTPDIINYVSEYKDYINNAKRIQSDINKIQREKESTAAIDLWDSL